MLKNILIPSANADGHATTLTNHLITFLFLILSPLGLSAQVTHTANDSIRPYSGTFRAGVNFDIYPGFSDENLAILAAGRDGTGSTGAGVKAIRPGLFEDFLELYGYNARANAFRLYDST
jgi:hypothetical protein